MPLVRLSWLTGTKHFLNTKGSLFSWGPVTQKLQVPAQLKIESLLGCRGPVRSIWKTEARSLKLQFLPSLFNGKYYGILM